MSFEVAREDFTSILNTICLKVIVQVLIILSPKCEVLSVFNFVVAIAFASEFIGYGYQQVVSARP